MSIESLLIKMGISYKVIDDEAVARCPYHNDSHPSWSVNLSNGLHYCFACGAKGTLATLLRDILGYSYAEAVIVANETVGYARMDKWRENHESISFSPMSLKVTDADMALFTDPPQDALESKNITLESAQHYGIKWNPEHQSWIFPYRDPYSNELWGWQEKNARIFRNYPAGTKKSKTLFGIDKLDGDGALILESPVDCAVVKELEYDGMVSSFGIPSLYQLSLIQNKRCWKMMFVLDNDKAGITATRELIPEALKMFRRVRVFNYRDCGAKDVGEMNYYDIDEGFRQALPALEWLRRST